MDGWNTTFLLGRPIFRGYVSFREGKLSFLPLDMCNPPKVPFFQLSQWLAESATSQFFQTAKRDIDSYRGGYMFFVAFRMLTRHHQEDTRFFWGRGSLDPNLNRLARYVETHHFPGSPPFFGVLIFQM